MNRGAVQCRMGNPTSLAAQRWQVNFLSCCHLNQASRACQQNYLSNLRPGSINLQQSLVINDLLTSILGASMDFTSPKLCESARLSSSYLSSHWGNPSGWVMLVITDPRQEMKVENGKTRKRRKEAIRVLNTVLWV